MIPKSICFPLFLPSRGIENLKTVEPAKVWGYIENILQSMAAYKYPISFKEFKI